MPINQPIIWRAKSRRLRTLLGVSLKSVLPNRAPWLARQLLELFVGERVVEYPFVFLNMPEARDKVLDVGCYGSTIPVELASLGYKVWGIDVQPYPLQHPNFAFAQGDICHTPFADNFFDVIIAVSTIEHIGLERYGDPAHEDGDKKAIGEISRILKPGGRFIITVPFGEKGISSDKGVALHRVYDLPALEQLLSGLELKKLEAYARKQGNWLPVSFDEASGTSEEGARLEAVALVVADKR